MQCDNLFTQERGPDEDFHIPSPKLQKVIDNDDHFASCNSGIFSVEKGSPLIEKFLDNVPALVRQDGVFGLIWNKSLQPSDGRYEPGEHFCRTREPERKSVHGSVSFYRDGESGEKFAIKTLQDTDHFHCWEIKISLYCNSSNLCSVYGIIVRNQMIHILMEHAGSELIKERSWIAASADRTLEFAKQSFQALHDLHNCGFVHCDIKPDNIMIVRNQREEFVVKVVDFGSCQPIGGILPADAHTTRFYWSPEIWQSLSIGEQVICQPAMDVYALALTLYFLATAGHLMNMLQERDILPLMTQRSDDLLLIALPETIPSGLRAVMRPCLAGRAEERWSAQQAARQLDGDAMMQRALSNPRSGNYKDLFQQLLQSKSGDKEKAEEGRDISTFPVSDVQPHQVVTASNPKAENVKLNKESLITVPAVSSNLIFVEKKDSDLSLKKGVERKCSHLAKPKKQGSLINIKKSKTLPKGRIKNANVQRQKGFNTEKVQTDVDCEIMYISSDETMPCPTKGKVQVQGTANMMNENVKDVLFLPDLSTGAKSATENIARNNLGITTCGWTDRPGEEAESTDPNKQSFSCSALLANLATQARSSDVIMLAITNQPNLEPAVPQSSSDQFFIGNQMEKLRLTQKKLCGPEIVKTPSSYLSNEAKASTSGEQPAELGFSRHPVEASNMPGSAEDEMDFVFEALEVPRYTGQAEDILDNLCHMLDNSDQVSTAAVSNGHVNQANDSALLSNKTHKRGKNCVNSFVRNKPESGPSKSPHQQTFGRKRVSESNESAVPVKVQARVSNQNAFASEQLLPNFNEILPGNVK